MVNDQTIHDLNEIDCLIIDDFKNNSLRKIILLILNQSKQLSYLS